MLEASRQDSFKIGRASSWKNSPIVRTGGYVLKSLVNLVAHGDCDLVRHTTSRMLRSGGFGTNRNGFNLLCALRRPLESFAHWGAVFLRRLLRLAFQFQPRQALRHTFQALIDALVPIILTDR